MSSGLMRYLEVYFRLFELLFPII